MAGKARVLYLSPYFWPEEIGSAPYCAELSFYLANKGNDVTTIAFRPHYPKPEPFVAWADGSRDRESHRGVDILRVAVSQRGAGGVKERLKNDLRYLFASSWWALTGRAGKSDVVVAYVPSIFTLYVAGLLRMTRGVRVVAVVHDIESGLATSLGMASGSVLPRFMRLVERIGLAFAQEVVVLTQGMKDELIAIGCKTPITILPIWADVAPTAEIDPSGPPTVAYSGNFGKKQNLDQLLPLIERLWRERPDVSVVLRGDGSEKERIRREIEGRQIGNTRFLPLAPAEEFVAALQSVNLHLVPQASNVANYALPSKLFSIMSAGRPYACIAPPDSPLEYFAEQSGAGICVSPGDDEALWKVVTGILDDVPRQRHMGEAGRAFVERNMNRSDILAKYESIICTDDGVARARRDASK